MNHARKHPLATPLFHVPKAVKQPALDRVRHYVVMASLSAAMAASAGCAIWYLTPLHHLARH